MAETTAVELHRTGFLRELEDFLRARGVIEPVVDLNVALRGAEPRVEISVRGSLA